jgi:hypothetical protein
MRLFQILVLLLVVSCATALARLGETADQFAGRYGTPKDTPGSKIMDKNFPLLEGAIYHIYEYQGWKIRAAFAQPDGPAVRIDYSKILAAGVNATIEDYELQAIMNADTSAGMTWK